MANAKLEIKRIFPALGIEGGLVYIECRGFHVDSVLRGKVNFDQVPGHIVSASEDLVIARIPAGMESEQVTLAVNGKVSAPGSLRVAEKLAEELHPVANPAIDTEGNIYTTVSGSRGERVPFSLYKITPQGEKQPYPADIMNPTGLALDTDGHLYISSRYNGAIYRITRDDELERIADDLGIATGIAFDRENNLFVGDRNGVIFKLSPSGMVSEFVKLEPSVSAYHLAFSQEGNLYVSSPTLATQDPIYEISPSGQIDKFFPSLGRPQGMAFDEHGNLYVGASYKGKRGVFRISQDKEVTHLIAAPVPVGLAFDGKGFLVVANTDSLYRVFVGINGKLLD
jgi:sugar lactone lactonase YvrE